jgi:hypothetical protein
VVVYSDRRFAQHLGARAGSDDAIHQKVSDTSDHNNLKR